MVYPLGLHHFLMIFLSLLIYSYFTSSKTTLTDYQCVSTGCCIHVAKTEITIDSQHVTKSLQRYRFLPKQPKENTEKITSLMIFLDSDGLYMEEVRYLYPNYSVFILSWAIIIASLQRSRSCSSSTASMNLSASHKVSISFSS